MANSLRCVRNGLWRVPPEELREPKLRRGAGVQKGSDGIVEVGSGASFDGRSHSAGRSANQPAGGVHQRIERTSDPRSRMHQRVRHRTILVPRDRQEAACRPVGFLPERYESLRGLVVAWGGVPRRRPDVRFDLRKEVLVPLFKHAVELHRTG